MNGTFIPSIFLIALTVAAMADNSYAAEPINPEKLPGKFFFIGLWEQGDGDAVADLIRSIYYKREIYVAPANGKERRHLVKKYHSIWDLSWHENRKSLAFILNSDTHKPDGFVEFDLSNWGGQELQPSQARKMLPDDFPTPYYNPALRIGANERAEAIPGERAYETRVTFSPDGSKVAGVSKGHICVTDAKGAQPAKCVTDLELCSGDSPVWSPDGSRIVFVGPTPDDSGNCNLIELYIADADGRNVRQLTDIRGAKYPESGSSVIKPGVKVAYRHKTHMPAWSPDGQWIAFFSTQGVGKIRPDGTGFQVIAKNASNPTWSPDSKMIAYTAARGDTLETFRYGIFVSWADGTGETWITKDLEMFRGRAQFVYEDLNWAK